MVCCPHVICNMPWTCTSIDGWTDGCGADGRIVSLPISFLLVGAPARSMVLNSDDQTGRLATIQEPTRRDNYYQNKATAVLLPIHRATSIAIVIGLCL